MRVLLLEDNLSNADIYQQYLKKSGFTVDHVCTLIDTEDAVAVTDYDILLLDRQVPDGDSRVWLSQVRKSGVSVPVLFLTVRDTIEDRIEGLDAGADDYMPKPVAPKELEARIRAILRRPKDMISSKLVCGNLSFDTKHRETCIHDKPVKISKREGCLLERLMRRTNHVVTKTSLEEGLYGHGEEVTPNSIEVCVCRLRKNLEKGGAKVDIHTIRGVGYLIRERVIN
ncbi:response regulator transcription factor [Parasulfitobacter algicola]|uniref:Response regulator transcription factor n=1 Tax=Parasulfitobacter algicola TaxID=2614809 RepID=A0ABX2IW57_9RHOB|nr:response regulator transcription factor [Sulfitobacter algicola]NSX56775.1 response regulator transcription factor [Sulfitobacter algicola]